MVGVATKQTPFKLVLAFDLHVSYDHSQHLFMNVDSRYPVRHNFPPGRSGERAASSLSRVTGYRRSRRGERQRPIIRSTTHAPDQTRGQPQLLHCEINLAAPKPLPFCLRLGVIFMKFRGPQALVDTWAYMGVQPPDEEEVKVLVQYMLANKL